MSTALSNEQQKERKERGPSPISNLICPLTFIFYVVNVIRDTGSQGERKE
jgi:hypothetical protein